jgi:ferredoxin
MPYSIGLHCTACGECLSLCPNGAIQGSVPRLFIEPRLCTECLFFDTQSRCVEACAFDAIHPVEMGDWMRVDEIVPARATHPALRPRKKPIYIKEKK